MYYYIAYILSALLWMVSFDPFACSEAAWVFAVPVLLANMGQSPSKKTWLCSYLMCMASWVAILAWLRFVYPPYGVLGMLLLPAAIACFYAPFFALCGYFLSERFSQNSWSKKIFAMLAFSAFWVVMEFLRSNMFTGFGWLCLGHSQYCRPALLQSAAIGGVYMLSFIIIAFNIGIAKYVIRLIRFNRVRLKGVKGKISVCPEFYLAVLLLMFNILLYAYNLPLKSNAEYMFRAGCVQTDLQGFRKWDAQNAQADLKTLTVLTKSLKSANVDVALWPEAATPPTMPIVSSPFAKSYAENLAKDLGFPILGGTMAFVAEHGKYKAQNAVCFVSENNGLLKEYYAKTKLVPFGEYMPFWCSFLKSVVPVGEMKRGENFMPLNTEIAGKNYKAGVMICYEDIFEQLGRRMAKNGADFLFVCTNDSWYGKEGGAYQHAAHSALQAVSLRKPLLRASVNGLSCVFNEYGAKLCTITLMSKDNTAYNGANQLKVPLDIFDENNNKLNPYTYKILKPAEMANENNTVYFRGAAFTDVYRFKNFSGQSFYVRYGYLFPYFCAGLLALFYAAKRRSLKRPSPIRR